MKRTVAHGRMRHRVAVATGLMAGVASLACATQGGSAGSGTGDAPVSSAAKGFEELTAPIGQSLEVAELTATVSEVKRQKSFGGVAEAGYVVATVTVANESSAARDYHRLQFGLVKPDGTTVKRTPVAGQAQLGDGKLEPGEKVSGTLIFTVEQAGGRFALTFEPRQDDQPEKQRGVWAFESQPGEAT